MCDMSSPPGWRLPGAAPVRQNGPGRTAIVSLLHTVQLCIHWRANPAGFWVGHNSAKAVRRPWCLSCCDVLDPDRYDVTRFGS
jgi:hypothetical protein